MAASAADVGLPAPLQCASVAVKLIEQFADLPSLLGCLSLLSPLCRVEQLGWGWLLSGR